MSRWPEVASMGIRELARIIAAQQEEIERLEALEKQSVARMSGLRLALRAVGNVADAAEPCSVQAARIAGDALVIDDREALVERGMKIVHRLMDMPVP